LAQGRLSTNTHWPPLMAASSGLARLVGALLLAKAPHPHGSSPSGGDGAVRAAATAAAAAGAAGRWGSEQDLLTHISSGGEQQGDLVPLLRSCVSRSWWTAARRLVSRTHEDTRRGRGQGGGFAPIHDELTSLLAEVKRSADDFAAFADAAYRGRTQGLDEVPCALQWAQNSSAVFVGVKYAARWSAPGAIEVVDVKVNISRCCFELTGFGHHSSVRKRYAVNLDLYGDIVAETSSWSAASVGRLTATLQKADASVKWPRLTQAKSRSKHQIGKWLDMEERWSEELKDNSKKKEKRDTKAASAEKSERRKGGGKAKEKRVPLHAVRKFVRRRWRQVTLWHRKLNNYSPSLSLLVVVFVCGNLALILVLALTRVCRYLSRRWTGHSLATSGEAKNRAAEAAQARLLTDRAQAPGAGSDSALLVPGPGDAAAESTQTTDSDWITVDPVPMLTSASAATKELVEDG